MRKESLFASACWWQTSCKREISVPESSLKCGLYIRESLPPPTCWPLLQRLFFDALFVGNFFVVTHYLSVMINSVHAVEPVHASLESFYWCSKGCRFIALCTDTCSTLLTSGRLKLFVSTQLVLPCSKCCSFFLLRVVLRSVASYIPLPKI